MSADTGLLRGYPLYAHKYSQSAKLLWKTSIGRRRQMHSDEVWMHHKFSPKGQTYLTTDYV